MRVCSAVDIAEYICPPTDASVVTLALLLVKSVTTCKLEHYKSLLDGFHISDLFLFPQFGRQGPAFSR